ncbi:MAG: hypothetical protein IPG00_22320 [Saprospiraceae bacterium]|nr:hypothetical protein [Saprospiraceae bacterium]
MTANSSPNIEIKPTATKQVTGSQALLDALIQKALKLFLAIQVVRSCQCMMHFMIIMID